jgi:hypothetical protein
VGLASSGSLFYLSGYGNVSPSSEFVFLMGDYIKAFFVEALAKRFVDSAGSSLFDLFVC